MSSAQASCCFPSVKKHIYIRFGFCDIQNNQGLGYDYQLQPSASADNPYLVFFQGIIVTEFFSIKGELMNNTSGLLENVKAFTCFVLLGSFFRVYFFFFLNNIPVSYSVFLLYEWNVS